MDIYGADTPAARSALSRALRPLVRAGYVEWHGPSAVNPDRRLFKLTRRGCKALALPMAEGAAGVPMRDRIYPRNASASQRRRLDADWVEVAYPRAFRGIRYRTVQERLRALELSGIDWVIAPGPLFRPELAADRRAQSPSPMVARRRAHDLARLDGTDAGGAATGWHSVRVRNGFSMSRPRQLAALGAARSWLIGPGIWRV